MQKQISSSFTYDNILYDSALFWLDTRRYNLHKCESSNEARNKTELRVVHSNFRHYHKFTLGCHSLNISRFLSPLRSRHECLSSHQLQLFSCLHNKLRLCAERRTRRLYVCIYCLFFSRERVEVSNEILNRHFVFFSVSSPRTQLSSSSLS